MPSVGQRRFGAGHGEHVGALHWAGTLLPLLFSDWFALSPPLGTLPLQYHSLAALTWHEDDPEEKDLLLCLEKSDFTQHSQPSSPVRPDSLGDHSDLARLSSSYL